MFGGGAALRFAAIEQSSPRTDSALSEHEHKFRGLPNEINPFPQASARR